MVGLYADALPLPRPSLPPFQIRPAPTHFDRRFGFKMNRGGFNDVRSLHSAAWEMLTALISPPELVRRRRPLPLLCRCYCLIVQCTALSVAVGTEAADK